MVLDVGLVGCCCLACSVVSGAVLVGFVFGCGRCLLVLPVCVGFDGLIW